MGFLNWLLGGRRESTPHTDLRPSGDFDFDVVGESNYQAELSAICGGHCEEGVEHECTALLVPEPTNPHDANAVKVVIEGRTIGYLSRQHAILYRRRIGGAGRCGALVVGGWDRGNGDRGHFGVKLDLAWPPGS